MRCLTELSTSWLHFAAERGHRKYRHRNSTAVDLNIVTFLLRTSKPIPVLTIPVAVVLDYGTSEMERNEKAAREAPNHNKLEYISAMQ
jgi:hypothetical protein